MTGIFKGKWQIKIVSKSKYSPVGLFTEVEIASPSLNFAEEMKTSQRNVIKPRNVSERQALNKSTFNFSSKEAGGFFGRKIGAKFGESLDGPI